MKIVALLLVGLLSGCAEIISVDTEMLGMVCSAKEIRPSYLSTVTAFGCRKPNGEYTNLVGGAGTSAAQIVIDVAKLAEEAALGAMISGALRHFKFPDIKVEVPH